MIRLLLITNPIEPGRGVVVHEYPPCGRHLELLLLDHLLATEADVLFSVWALTHRVALNGLVREAKDWPLITPRDGDEIVITPIVSGGGLLRSLSSLALLAATIALSVTPGGQLFAAGIATFLGAPLLAVSTATSILVGAVNIAGNLLISALLGPKGKATQNTSPSLDPDGPQTLARSGTGIPKGYGTMLWGGNIISSFTELAGSDQFINILVCFGFGPARSLTGIQINGKDIYTYQNCQYYTRLGTNDQTEIGQFNQISNGYPQDTECLAGVGVIVPGTGTLTQALQVDISFPSGIFVDTNDGNIIPAVITYLVEYRLSGSLTWLPVVQPQTTASVIQLHSDGTPYFPGGNQWGVIATDLDPRSNVVYHVDSGPHNPGDKWTGTQTVEVFQPNGNHSTYSKTVQGEWQFMDIDQNYVYVLTWSAGYQDFVAAQTTPCYNRTNILGLAPGKYDVQITKYGCTRLHDDVPFGDNFSPNIGQDMWVHSVNEIAYLDLCYPNMILLAIRALATSQLSGSGIKVTALVEHGLRTLDEGLLPVALQSYPEDNAALVAADMMLDTLYGGGAWPGIAANNIERFIDEWNAWAEQNENLLPDGSGGNIRQGSFNGVFDNDDNLWNQLTRVGQMSRAMVMPQGLDYGVYLDAPVDAPVQMFTVGNILQDSFSEIWLPVDDRTNQVEVEFADKTRYYKTDNPIAYMDPAMQDAGVTIKATRVKAVGVTDPAQAWHLARYMQRSTSLLLRTGSFRTDIDGIACRAGNVIALQHDVPAWGFGGRTLPGSTTTQLLMDRNDLPFVSGTSYSVMVQHAAVQRYTGTVTGLVTTTQPAGLQLSLSSFDNGHRVTRIVFGGSGNGYDAAVLNPAAGMVTITTPLPAGVVIAAGTPYTLFDTDVQDTAPVASVELGATDEGMAIVNLSAPLSQTPDDFGLYIYGPVGGVKLARVTRITKASEFRATVEWIDYNADVWDVATPVIGETSAVSSSNPGVTTLTGGETFQLAGGSYVNSINLAWRNGPDTVGVGIYQSFPGQPGLSQLVARLTGYPQSWSTQVAVGIEVEYTVVGFDANNRYAALSTAPSITITTVGVTKNLLLGSDFASGFTYWNVSPRAGDALVPTLANDSEAVYTVAGTALTSPQTLLSQSIPASKWAAGDLLMLSAYFETDNPAGAMPLGSLDTAVDAGGGGATVPQTNPLYVAGWAGDPSGAKLASLVICIDGVPFDSISTGTARSDVAAVHGAYFSNSGYVVAPSMASVAPGSHAITVVATSLGGEVLTMGPVTITVTAATGTPAGSTPSVTAPLVNDAGTGNLVAAIQFTPTSGSPTTVRAVLTMAGAPLPLTRVFTAATAIPAGTTDVSVLILVDGSGLSLPIASTLDFSHLLLEIAATGQTAPSAWADIDVNGAVLDFFTGGSSSGARTQGSVLPVSTGSFSYAYTSSSVTPSWSGLIIVWPDGAITNIQNGSGAAVGSLAAATSYYAYAYFDVVLGQVKFITDGADSGSPMTLYSAQNPTAAAACYYDGRIALTPNGLKMTTGTGTGTGTGSGGGKTPGDPGDPIPGAPIRYSPE